jgi:hypothetical protein
MVKKKRAIVYADRFFHCADGKTAHGLVRHSKRFDVACVVDSTVPEGDVSFNSIQNLTSIPFRKGMLVRFWMELKETSLFTTTSNKHINVQMLIRLLLERFQREEFYQQDMKKQSPGLFVKVLMLYQVYINFYLMILIL